MSFFPTLLFSLWCACFAYSGKAPAPIEGIKIGAQTWAARNVATPTPDAFLAPGTKPVEYLYSWEDAQKLAKAAPGWRLPTEADWRKLEVFLGSPDYEKNMANRTGGAQLKKYPEFNVFPGQTLQGDKYNWNGERALYWTSTSISADDGNTYVVVIGLSKEGMKKDQIYHHATSPLKKNGIKMSVRLIKE